MMNSGQQDGGSPLDEHLFKLLAMSAVLLIAAGTVVYHILEGWSWVDSLYFSVVAVTTVGFGDLTPTTDASKLFTVGYLVFGVALITTYLNVRFKHRAAQRAKKAEKRKHGSDDVTDS